MNIINQCINQKIVRELVRYQELENQLQVIIGVNLETLIDIAKTGDLKINDNSVYKIADIMKKTGLSYCELRKLFNK